jgi:hypothetical protein
MKSTKHQAAEKVQTLSLKQMNAALIGVWSLKFLWSLEVGIWRFDI